MIPKLYRIFISAEAYYSHNYYEEEMFLTEEGYEELKDSIDCVNVKLYDFDGKHSCVEADIDVSEVDEEYFLNHKLVKDDGSRFFDRLCEQVGDSEVVCNYINQAYAIIDTIDMAVEVTYTIRQSQVELVDEFIQNLKDNA